MDVVKIRGGLCGQWTVCQQLVLVGTFRGFLHFKYFHTTSNCAWARLLRYTWPSCHDIVGGYRGEASYPYSPSLQHGVWRGAEVSAIYRGWGTERAQRQKPVCGIFCVIRIIGCYSVLSHTTMFVFLGFYMLGMSNTHSRQTHVFAICMMWLCVTVRVMVYILWWGGISQRKI